MTRRSRRRKTDRRWIVLALLLGVLQIASVVDCSTLLQVVASDHSHAWMKVVDGGHVDLVLSHETEPHETAPRETARPSGASEPRIHPKQTKDHVVHLAPDEAAAAQKRVAESPPATMPAPTPRVAASPAVPLAPAFAPCRTAVPFSRRSVVLRT